MSRRVAAILGFLAGIVVSVGGIYLLAFLTAGMSGAIPGYYESHRIIVENQRAMPTPMYVRSGFRGDITTSKGAVKLFADKATLPPGEAMLVSGETESDLGKEDRYESRTYLSFFAALGAAGLGTDEDGKMIHPIEFQSGRWKIELIDDEQGRLSMRLTSYKDEAAFKAECQKRSLRYR